MLSTKFKMPKLALSTKFKMPKLGLSTKFKPALEGDAASLFAGFR